MVNPKILWYKLYKRILHYISDLILHLFLKDGFSDSNKYPNINFRNHTFTVWCINQFDIYIFSSHGDNLRLNNRYNSINNQYIFNITEEGNIYANMRVGSFPQSDLILCIVNSKQISLDNTSNIECCININNDILIIFHRKNLHGKPCQNNFQNFYS